MNSGYLGSFIVHGVVLVAALSAASLVREDRAEAPVVPAPVIDLNPPGGDSGGPGGAAVPAPNRAPKPVRVDVLDSESILAAWRSRQVAPAPPAPVRPVSTPALRPVVPLPRAPVAVGIPAGPRRPLVAPTVDTGTSSPGPAGVANAPGVPGGAGPRAGNAGDFAASVRTAFAGTFVPLFRERGAGIASDNDSGEVKLRVSPAGNVTFAGWGARPAEALLEEIVLSAVATMRPVSPPPDGVEVVVRIRFSGTVE